MSSSDPDDPGNNPYAEGGASRSSASPAAASSRWFCHECHRDFDNNQLLRVPEPTCPNCRSSFVEQVEESIDDPHEFDRPDFPFALFTGQPSEATPNTPQGGPFAALVQQLMTGLVAQNNGQQRRDGSNAPPASPGQAAVDAAEQRARGEGTDGTANSIHHHTTTTIFRTPAMSFVWNSQPRRPSQPAAAGAHSQTPPPSVQPNENNQQQAPVQNLASFLQQAFGGQPQPSPQPSSRPPPTATSHLQEGEVRAPDQTRSDQDPLDHFLNMFGAVLPGAQTDGGANDGAGGGGTNATRHFVYGNPAQGSRLIFTFGNGTEQEFAGPGMMFNPLAALFGGGQEGEPGRMGDFVFTQGAFDNIITELMNQANGRYGPQPAPEEVIKELPTFKMTKELLTSDTISDCAVCKDDFVEEEDVMKLPCQHIFHIDCIRPWLERSGTCPVCRFALVEQPEPPRGPNAAPAPGAAAPVSPTQPQSPPIQGGSRMPGGFPGGFPFSLFGFGGNNQANTPSTDNRQQGESESEPQGQPDLDLDLD